MCLPGTPPALSLRLTEWVSSVAVELISTHIRRQLAERSHSFRSLLSQQTAAALDASAPDSHPENLLLLEQTPGLQGLHTFLRDRETGRNDFVHYSDRLASM